MKDKLLKIVQNPAVRKAAVALIVAVLAALGISLNGCASLKPALPGPERALCYANADQAAQRRVDAECRDVPFSECPAHDEIMAGLQADQEACE